jgi:hypothetical protein
MRKRKTFEELTNLIKEDKFKLKLPNREPLRIQEWFKQPMAELTEHQRRRAAHDVYQHEIRDMAMVNNVPHAQMQMMAEPAPAVAPIPQPAQVPQVPGPPGPAGPPGVPGPQGDQGQPGQGVGAGHMNQFVDGMRRLENQLGVANANTREYQDYQTGLARAQLNATEATSRMMDGHLGDMNRGFAHMMANGGFAQVHIDQRQVHLAFVDGTQQQVVNVNNMQIIVNQHNQQIYNRYKLGFITNQQFIDQTRTVNNNLQQNVFGANAGAAGAAGAADGPELPVAQGGALLHQHDLDDHMGAHFRFALAGGLGDHAIQPVGEGAMVPYAAPMSSAERIVANASAAGQMFVVDTGRPQHIPGFNAPLPMPRGTSLSYAPVKPTIGKSRKPTSSSGPQQFAIGDDDGDEGMGVAGAKGPKPATIVISPQAAAIKAKALKKNAAALARLGMGSGG